MKYDLMTKTPFRLRDVGRGSFFWSDIADFLKHLPADSAVQREIDGETAAWVGGDRTANILADLFDCINLLRHWLGGVAAEDVPPYPRPWFEDGDGGGKTRHFGSDPIRVADFDDWYYRTSTSEEVE